MKFVLGKEQEKFIPKMVEAMTYEEAKNIVRNLFDGVSQPVRIVMEALDIISERDYYDIQNENGINSNNLKN